MVEIRGCVSSDEIRNAERRLEAEYAASVGDPEQWPRVDYLSDQVERARQQAIAEASMNGGRTKPLGDITWQPLGEVEMQSIVFADKPLFQGSAFHIVGGRKGVGKGTLIAHSSARTTRGELGPKRSVIWIGSEDSAAIDIKPRVVAAGGDPDRVTVVKEGWIQLPRDIAEISRKMTEIGDVGLLVIDPVGNHIAGKDSNSETDIRSAIAPLNDLADEHGCMVFGVRHLTEKESKGGLVAAFLGSSAWSQVPRAVIAVVRDDEDPQISHVRCVLGNRLPADTPSRMFRIEGVPLPGLENEVTCGTWIGDSHKNIEEMFAKGGDKQPSKSATARELLLDILESEGDQESDTLDARVAGETGLAARTVQNQRKELVAEGLVKVFVVARNEDGTVATWGVRRTQAPRGQGPK
jgi:hypothetical protein